MPADRPKNSSASQTRRLPRIGAALAAGAAALILVTALSAGGYAGHIASAGWLEPGRDLASTRATAGGPIDARSVARLRVAWRFLFADLPTFSGVDAAAPLVVGRRVYVQTLESNVYALDAQTGKVLWKRVFSRASGGPNGLAAAGSRLFGNTDTSAFALDRASGRLLWIRRLTSAAQPIDIAPLAADGLVFTSSTGLHPGGRGTLFALDARSGRLVWSFDTIRGPWRVPTVASGGGAWWQPTLDGSGNLYVGNSNPLPWGGTRRYPNGGAYAGRDLYTDSLLVLDARTGKLRWYDQVTPHDVRDYDFAMPPMLASAGGTPLVIGAGKSGLVIAWNRRTHQRVWTASVGRHRNDEGPLPRRLVSVCPGLLGGVLTPMAYSDGRVFAPVVDLCMNGSATGYFPNFLSLDYARGRGELVALDAASGRRLWTQRLPSPAFGCATVARDVVLTATYAGVVYAFDTATGRQLWSVHEPAGINACPTVAGNLLLVGAGAAPLNTAVTPQLVAYRLPAGT
jgi:outer membrane protein assembly factor BamB